MRSKRNVEKKKTYYLEVSIVTGKFTYINVTSVCLASSALLLPFTYIAVLSPTIFVTIKLFFSLLFLLLLLQ